MVKFFSQKIHRNFGITISAGATEKLPGWKKTDAKTVARSSDMEGHAQKMRWEIPWTGKQSGGNVDRLGWPLIQTGGTWTNWRIIKSMLPNCLEMLVFSHEFVNLTFFGQWTNLLDRSRNGQEQVTDVTCSRFMGCADGSMTFIEQYQNTNQPSNSATVRGVTNPNPNNTETEMLINYSMWTTSPQAKILRTVNLSCTLLKTMKRW